MLSVFPTDGAHQSAFFYMFQAHHWHHHNVPCCRLASVSCSREWKYLKLVTHCAGQHNWHHLKPHVVIVLASLAAQYIIAHAGDALCSPCSAIDIISMAHAGKLMAFHAAQVALSQGPMLQMCCSSLAAHNASAAYYQCSVWLLQLKMQAAGHAQVKEALQTSLDEATIFKETAEAELSKASILPALLRMLSIHPVCVCVCVCVCVDFQIMSCSGLPM